MRRFRPITENEVVCWNAETLTVVQDRHEVSRHSLLLLPPQVFVEAEWRSATLVIAGAWEFRMHLVDYKTPFGASMPCAVIHILDEDAFAEWCVEVLELVGQDDANRMRVIVQTGSGEAINIDTAYEWN
jgi:hypothetical protein